MNNWLFERKSSISEGWLRRIFETYPPEAATFLSNQNDRFANPIGSAFLSAAGPILEELFGEGNPETVEGFIDEIIRIRAVQDFRPSDSVSIFFLLKLAIRDEMTKEKEGQDKIKTEDILFLESKIDKFSLAAFDIYMKCRERVWEIRFNDFIKRPFVLSEAAMCPSYLIKKGMIKDVGFDGEKGCSLS